MARARIERLERAKAKLNALPDAMRAGIAEALDNGADEIVAAQKRMAPFRKGNLRNSIRKVRGEYKPENSNVRGVSVGANKSGLPDDLRIQIVAGDAKAWYARLVEFGVRKDRTVKNYFGQKGVAVSVGSSRAKPFFYPVYRAYRKRVKARVSRAVGKAARQVARG